MRHAFLFEFIAQLETTERKDLDQYLSTKLGFKHQVYALWKDLQLKKRDTELTTKYKSYTKLKHNLQSYILDFFCPLNTESKEEYLKNKASFLLKRGFIEESIKLSDKLLEHFLKQEKFVDAFNTVAQQGLITMQYIHRINRKKGFALVLHYNELGQKFLQQMSNLTEHHHILIELEDFRIKDDLLGEELDKYYQKLINLPTYSVKSRYYRLIGLTIVYTITNDYKALIDSQKELLLLVKNNTAIFGSNPKFYIKQAINLVLSLIDQGKYDEAKNIVSDLIIEHKSLKDKELKNLFTILFDFNTIILHWNFKTVQDIYSKIQKKSYWLESYEHLDQSLLLIPLFILLLMEDYKLVLHYIRHYYEKLYSFPIFIPTLIILELIAYIELEYGDELEYKIRNFRYLLKKNKLNSSYMQQVLKFLNTHSLDLKNPSKKMLSMLNKVSDNLDLSKKENTPYLINVSSFYLFEFYLKSKINHRSIFETYKAEYTILQNNKK
jgi:hypothetical protein